MNSSAVAPLERSPAENPDWPAIRQAYAAGEGALRALAVRFGVPRRTLEDRCKREGWAVNRERLERLPAVAVEAAEAAAREQGRQHGLSAAKVKQRTLQTAEAILDRIDRALQEPKIDARELRLLIQTWRDSVELARVTHGMDVGGAASTVFNVAIVNALADAHFNAPEGRPVVEVEAGS